MRKYPISQQGICALFHFLTGRFFDVRILFHERSRVSWILGRKHIFGQPYAARGRCQVRQAAARKVRAQLPDGRNGTPRISDACSRNQKSDGDHSAMPELAGWAHITAEGSIPSLYPVQSLDQRLISDTIIKRVCQDEILFLPLKSYEYFSLYEKFAQFYAVRIDRTFVR